MPCCSADVVERADVRMVRAARSRAPRVRSVRGTPGRPRAPRQDLDRDRAIEPRVAGPVDLAHAAGAEGRDDFVRAETGAGCEGQGWRDYTSKNGQRTESVRINVVVVDGLLVPPGEPSERRHGRDYAKKDRDWQHSRAPGIFSPRHSPLCDDCQQVSTTPAKGTPRGQHRAVAVTPQSSAAAGGEPWLCEPAPCGALKWDHVRVRRAQRMSPLTSRILLWGAGECESGATIPAP